MNHKQKIGYTILGAGIMLIGMLIDNLTSSPVTAQNDGEITCQKLTFVDETGKPLFTFSAKKKNTNSLDSLLSGITETLFIRDKDGKSAIELSTGTEGGRVDVHGKDGEPAISLIPYDFGGNVLVRNNNNGKVSVAMTTDASGGRVDVFNKQGKNRAVMSVNEYGNGAVFTWDKNGYRLR